MDLIRAILADPWGFAALAALWFGAVSIILFFREIRAGWVRLTDRVMSLLDRWWVLNYLPEEKGGKGRFTIVLGDGERVEFCVPRSGAVKWFTWAPFPDPGLKRDEERGYPPLAIWFVGIPLLSITLALLTRVVVSFVRLSFDSAVLPLSWVAGSLLIAGAALVPIYWVYEWCRKHEYWFQTSFVMYIICFRPFGRMTRPVSPVEWMKETRIRSLWADKPVPLAQIGGWITHRWDFGTVLIGSIAYGAFFDFFAAWRNITAFQEILQTLYGRAKDSEDYKKAVQRMLTKVRLEGVAKEALRGVTATGASPLAEAHRKIAAIEAEFRSKIPPGGEEVNLADWREWLGFTHWDLETGEELPAPIKVPV